MGLLKKVGDLLFGKEPDIFNERGQVQHKLPEKKWQDWDQRLKTSASYDWRRANRKPAEKVH